MRAWLLVTWLTCAASWPSAAGVPVTFGRADRQIHVVVAAGIDMTDATPQRVVLRAFGRQWTEPQSVEKGVVRITVPDVQRVTLFSLVPTDESERELGELIAYPATTTLWGKAPVWLHAMGVLPWFDQWIRACGSTIRHTDLEGLRHRKRPHKQEATELLVVGRSAAGEDWADVAKTADEFGINVLVLEANWFGKALKRRFTVDSNQMCGALADIAQQRWVGPLTFQNAAGFWPGRMNRQAWIHHKGRPLVEKVGPLGAERKVVLSYLPLFQQLGRVEVADEMLRAVIRRASDPKRIPVKRRRLQILYLSHREQDEQTLEQDRPVLADAMAFEFKKPPVAPPLTLVDLRGPAPLPDDLLTTLRKSEAWFNEDHPLLILGDDPILDAWKWLKLDRSKQTTDKIPGVRWLPDDTLPAPMDAQVMVMNALSNEGVPLTETPQEK